MTSKIFLVADFFYRDFTGGAELNDFSLVERFRNRGFEVEEMYCRDLSVDFLKKYKDNKFIVANFVSLGLKSVDYMINNIDYVIYEHDHKYLKKRNPIFYKDFHAPEKELVNIEFFKAAKSVICLTQLAKDVIILNTGLTNVTKIGGSVWRDQDLDYILTLQEVEKNDKYAVMNSDNPIKKRQQIIQYCEKNNIPYDLIGDSDHFRFLEKLSKYKGLIFMTGHLETCCRLLVEAKMLNCKIKYQPKLIGAASEPWFSLDGPALVEKIRNVSEGSVDIFLEALGI